MPSFAKIAILYFFYICTFSLSVCGGIRDNVDSSPEFLLQRRISQRENIPSWAIKKFKTQPINKYIGIVTLCTQMLKAPWTTMINRSLTHWGRVTHTCVTKLTIIGSDNGLSPGGRQAIIWTNDGILLTGTWGTNENVVCGMVAILSRPQCVKKTSSDMISMSTTGKYHTHHPTVTVLL